MRQAVVVDVGRTDKIPPLLSALQTEQLLLSIVGLPDRMWVNKPNDGVIHPTYALLGLMS